MMIREGMNHLDEEGVIKFSCDHSNAELSGREERDLAFRLMAWRELMFATGLVGQDPGRYGGAGYGNLSGRLAPFLAAAGARSFVVSGTQTGGKERLVAEDFCVIREYDTPRNRVVSTGPILPSSESMTHGTIYDLSPDIRFVFHAHAPQIWNRAELLDIPMSDPTVPYGTPEMAREVLRLYEETGLPGRRILAMGGHRDGIIAFGETAEEVGGALMGVQARAAELVLLEAEGRV